MNVTELHEGLEGLQNNVGDEEDAGVNVGDEEDVGDKVGGDQSWHQVAASPAGPPSQFFATLPSYLSLLHFSTLWHGMVHAISFRVVYCCYVVWFCIIVSFVWFCMVWWKPSLSVSFHPFLACKTGQSWEVSNGEMFAKFGVEIILG